MKKIIFDDLSVQPWKNGQGATRQVMIFPFEATLDNFIWRASIANVTQKGAFSLYPNVKRSLILLSGNNLELKIDKDIHKLDCVNQHYANQLPLVFDGGVASEVLACPEPVLDFGIMSQNEYCEHKLEFVSLKDNQVYTSLQTQALIFSNNINPIFLEINDEIIMLDQYDALFIDKNDSKQIKLNTLNSLNSVNLIITEIFLK
ncbi:hypothetical protein AwWohl_02050 [Gammaproteobacteria bacterium]|nr:hypothetical protein AwWohl_02050 [Gammaproteobacteria bacterium]